MTEHDFRRLARGGSFVGETDGESHLLQQIGFVVAIAVIAGLLLLVAPAW